jgi:hypothetical protein
MLTGGSAAAKVDATKTYPEQLKKITEEADHLPEQDFNADQTGK